MKQNNFNNIFTSKNINSAMKLISEHLQNNIIDDKPLNNNLTLTPLHLLHSIDKEKIIEEYANLRLELDIN